MSLLLTDHVVLFSIDGLRPEIYRDERWPAPVLQDLAKRGALALAVRSVFPALTYPAHVTLVTGALPARHGVVHNEPFEPRERTGRWIWDAAAIRSRTLWEAVRERGGRTAAVSWPVTVGAHIDWNVPDVWDPDDTTSIGPIRQATTPPGLFEELEREATGRLSDEGFSVDVLAREDAVGAMAAYLFKRHRPMLTLVHVIGLDHVRHRLGLDNAWARRAVGAADRAVGRVVETVERLGLLERTTFLITGDHGAVDVHTALAPNVWLAGTSGPPGTSALTECVAFLASGGSALLRPVTSDHRNLDAAIPLVHAALEALPRGMRTLCRVVSRDELHRLGADPDALLALAAIPGVTFSSESKGPAVSAAHGAGHGYHPELREMTTGFVAAGAGIRAGAVIPMLRLEDVAPLVAALLALDLPDTDGTLLPGLLPSRPERNTSARP